MKQSPINYFLSILTFLSTCVVFVYEWENLGTYYLEVITIIEQMMKAFGKFLIGLIGPFADVYF
jgi:hypothetical protein